MGTKGAGVCVGSIEGVGLGAMVTVGYALGVGIYGLVCGEKIAKAIATG